MTIVRREYDKALELDPQNVEVRLDYAAVLEKFSLPHEAAEQYRAALLTNSQYHRDEPKRLKPERVREIEAKVQALGTPPASTQASTR